MYASFWYYNHLLTNDFIRYKIFLLPYVFWYQVHTCITHFALWTLYETYIATYIHTHCMQDIIIFIETVHLHFCNINVCFANHTHTYIHALHAFKHTQSPSKSLCFAMCVCASVYVYTESMSIITFLECNCPIKHASHIFFVCVQVCDCPLRIQELYSPLCDTHSLRVTLIYVTHTHTHNHNTNGSMAEWLRR